MYTVLYTTVLRFAACT